MGEEIASPRLRGLYRLWAGRAGAGLPARRDFSHRDFQPWMGWLGILRCEPEGLRVTLSGTAVVESDGRDFTGLTLEEAIAGPLRDPLLAPFYQARRRRLAVYDLWRPEIAGLPAMHRLVLPCADDGRTVDRLLFGLDVDWRLLRRRGLTTRDIAAAWPLERHSTVIAGQANPAAQSPPHSA